jgi:hypothetical protein
MSRITDPPTFFHPLVVMGREFGKEHNAIIRSLNATHAAERSLLEDAKRDLEMQVETLQETVEEGQRRAEGLDHQHLEVEGLRKAVESIHEELREVSAVVRRGPGLKTALNGWLAGCAIGLGVCGTGCCSPGFSTEGFPESAGRPLNGLTVGAVIAGGMGVLGVVMGFL